MSRNAIGGQRRFDDQMEKTNEGISRHYAPTQFESSASAIPELSGDSALIRNVLTELERASLSASPVVITGEVGTHKRVIARTLHQLSHRGHTKPFCAIDCFEIPVAQLDATLFGSRTKSGHKGRIEEAAGGTMVIENVVQLPADLQKRLADSIESGQFHSTERFVPFTARVIATSRRQIIEFAARQEFDERLYNQLKSTEISVPALRNRPEDIRFIAEQLRPRLNASLRVAIQGISDQALDLLEKYSWPGNIRELERALESAYLMATTPVLLPEHLPPEIRAGATAERNGRRGRDEAQKKELIDTLNWAGWNVSKAARRLGLSRETLYRRMEKYELAGHTAK